MGLNKIGFIRTWTDQLWSPWYSDRSPGSSNAIPWYIVNICHTLQCNFNFSAHFQSLWSPWNTFYEVSITWLLHVLSRPYKQNADILLDFMPTVWQSSWHDFFCWKDCLKNNSLLQHLSKKASLWFWLRALAWRLPSWKPAWRRGIFRNPQSLDLADNVIRLKTRQKAESVVLRSNV